MALSPLTSEIFGGGTFCTVLATFQFFRPFYCFLLKSNWFDANFYAKYLSLEQSKGHSKTGKDVLKQEIWSFSCFGTSFSCFLCSFGKVILYRDVSGQRCLSRDICSCPCPGTKGQRDVPSRGNPTPDHDRIFPTNSDVLIAAINRLKGTILTRHFRIDLLETLLVKFVFCF